MMPQNEQNPVNVKTAMQCFLMWCLTLVGLIVAGIVFFFNPPVAYAIMMTCLIAGYMSITPIFYIGIEAGIKQHKANK